MAIPRPFLLKKGHSFLGFWLTLFLIEHLLTNSQAALFWNDYGAGFVRAVNWIQSLPFLKAIELLLLGIPLLYHGLYGLIVLRTAKLNSLPYMRNKAFSWQRITSWVLLIGIAAHVIQMRFVDYPKEESGSFVVELSFDDQLQGLANHVGAQILPGPKGKVIAKAESFGAASLLAVRDTFKNPLYVLLYTILVLAAAFHGFNGLWTFLISSGFTLTHRSQILAWRCSLVLMIVISLFGLSAVWGTYVLA